MTAVETFAAMLTDPWLMAGLGIGCIVLAIVVWLLRDERRIMRADRGHEDSVCRDTGAICQTCGWVSDLHHTEDEAWAALDAHVLRELERIS